MKKMREIKFRGYDTYNKKWVFGSYYKGVRVNEKDIDMTTHLTDCRICHNIIFEGKIFFIEDKMTIGQYVGLNDKNDKEIFEGDIVSYFDDSGKKHIGVVTWEQNVCSFYVNAIGGDDKGNQDIQLCGDYDLEILGNRFENHETYVLIDGVWKFLYKECLYKKKELK